MLSKLIKSGLLVVLINILLISSCFADQQSSTSKAQPLKSTEQNVGQVMDAFTSIEEQESELIKIDDQRKRVVMFSLGVPLLILLLVTGGLGVAMGVFGKPVFLAHMICASLSMTLALGHAIVGIVWFYPF